MCINHCRHFMRKETLNLTFKKRNLSSSYSPQFQSSEMFDPYPSSLNSLEMTQESLHCNWSHSGTDSVEKVHGNCGIWGIALCKRQEIVHLPVLFSHNKGHSHFVPHKSCNYFIVFPLDCILKYGGKSSSLNSRNLFMPDSSSVLFSPLSFGPTCYL